MTYIYDTMDKIKDIIKDITLKMQKDLDNKVNQHKIIEENIEILLKVHDPAKIYNNEKYTSFSTIATDYLFQKIEEYNNCIYELKKIIDDTNQFYKTLSLLDDDRVPENSEIYLEVIISIINNFYNYDNLREKRFVFLETYEQISIKCSQIYTKYCITLQEREQEQKTFLNYDDTIDVFSDAENEDMSTETTEMLYNKKEAMNYKEKELQCMEYDII